VESAVSYPAVYCVHRPIVDSVSKPNLSQLYLSLLSLAKLAKLNSF
jgi:hypothetical protein